MSENTTAYDLVNSIVPLVDEYAFTEKQTPAKQKNECRWEMGRVLSTSTSGDRRKDAPLLKEVSRQLNAQFRRGFAQTSLQEWLDVFRAFPNKEEIAFDLSWSHYQALGREPSHARRLRLMQKARERKWSVASVASRVAGAPRGYGCKFEAYDQLVLDLARSYTCSCGIISVDELWSIYQESSSSPIDDFDFQETLLYMDECSTSKDEPCLWKCGSTSYVIDRSLTDPAPADEARYDYGYEWGWNRTYERPSAFLGSLRRSYAGYVERRRLELVKAHARVPVKRLGPTMGEARELSSLAHWRDVEHLREYCLGDISSEHGRPGAFQTAFDRAIEQLVRHVSQHGIPSDAEIDEDAHFLLARTDYTRDYWDRRDNRSRSYVAGALKSLYWQVPLWEQNGHSAREADEVSLDETAEEAAGMAA